MGNVNWMYYLVNTKRPLEEKMALFWHHVFATGNSKVDNYDQLLEQIELFREQGMGNYRDLLLTIAKNPTMIFWLDNNQNHGTAVNENWGRELLELFSLGAGNYTETDVREARAPSPAGPSRPRSRGCPTAASPGSSSIARKITTTARRRSSATRATSTARTSSTSSCSSRPARSSSAGICTTSSSPTSRRCRPGIWSRRATRRRSTCWPRRSVTNKCEMKPVLRVLFNSDFFKNARFKHLKSPAEVVVGTLRLVGGYEIPKPGYGELSMQPSYMGQDLLNPPSVEGWHTGKEWINSGSLMARINFVAEKVGDTTLPGVQAIMNRLKAMGVLEPEQLVDACLDLLGPVEVGADTKKVLTEQAKQWGQIRWDTPAQAEAATKHTGELLQLIVATREYQFA